MFVGGNVRNAIHFPGLEVLKNELSKTFMQCNFRMMVNYREFVNATKFLGNEDTG